MSVGSTLGTMAAGAAVLALAYRSGHWLVDQARGWRRAARMERDRRLAIENAELRAVAERLAQQRKEEARLRQLDGVEPIWKLRTTETGYGMAIEVFDDTWTTASTPSVSFSRDGEEVVWPEGNPTHFTVTWADHRSVVHSVTLPFEIAYHSGRT